MTVYRSLSDLRAALPDLRARDANAGRHVRPPKLANRPQTGPDVWCARCGLLVPFDSLVKRRLGEDWYAYAHPYGECNESMVVVWRERLAAMVRAASS